MNIFKYRVFLKKKKRTFYENLFVMELITTAGLADQLFVI